MPKVRLNNWVHPHVLQHLKDKAQEHNKSQAELLEKQILRIK